MNSPLRYVGLCLAVAATACGEEARDPAAPEPTTPQQVAALETVTAAPALRVDAHALYYCYHPGTVRLCIVLKHQLRITSSGTALKWTASKDRPWIVLSSTGGTWKAAGPLSSSGPRTSPSSVGILDPVEQVPLRATYLVDEERRFGGSA